MMHARRAKLRRTGRKGTTVGWEAVRRTTKHGLIGWTKRTRRTIELLLELRLLLVLMLLLLMVLLLLLVLLLLWRLLLLLLLLKLRHLLERRRLVHHRRLLERRLCWRLDRWLAKRMD